MAITYKQLLEHQEENRAAFGRMLLNWRRRNGWTQYTACSWAEEAGFEAISYGNLSVIEQGKMDAVLNSKPDERRVIFEEAAGITKYKAKKKEALHLKQLLMSF